MNKSNPYAIALNYFLTHQLLQKLIMKHAFLVLSLAQNQPTSLLVFRQVLSLGRNNSTDCCMVAATDSWQIATATALKCLPVARPWPGLIYFSRNFCSTT